MSSVQAKYHALISAHLGPTLEKMGFSMRRLGWFYRLQMECVQRVVIPFDKKRASEEGDVTVTVCVGYRQLEQFLAACGELSTFVNFEVSPLCCTMGSNIGHLSAPFRYQSWYLGVQTEVAEIAPEIVRRIETDASQYFEKYGTLERVVDAWKKGERYNLGDLAVLYLAAHEWLHGDKSKAISDLKNEVISAATPAMRHRLMILLSTLESHMPA